MLVEGFPNTTNPNTTKATTQTTTYKTTTKPPIRPPPTEPPEVEPCYSNPHTDQSHPKPHKPVQIPDNPQSNVEPYPYNDVLGSDEINLASSLGLGFVTGGASVAVDSDSGIGSARGLATSGARGAATVIR